MPITAKLSKALYERLGEEVTDQLVDWFNQVDATSRSDLRELNEHNVARFEYMLNERMTSLESKLDRAFRDELTQLRTKDLTDIRIELREHEGRTLRWMFAYWITTIGAMITLLRVWS
jgi:hypothetical protein